MKKYLLMLTLMLSMVFFAACGGAQEAVEVVEDAAETVAEEAAEVVEDAAEAVEEAVEAEPEEAEEAAEEEMEEMEAMEEITVAYFLEWPTPNQFAQLEELYDEAMGVKVNWVSFDTGVAMSAAMASGDVQIAYSQGLVPFANAVSAGLPLKMVGVAVSYAENDNCVVGASAGIGVDNVTDLHGQKVAVPIGTVAHYKMLREMEHLGVDVAELEIVDLAPADGAAALERGDVAMACGWGGALARMKENGDILMTGAEMEEIGIKVFDVISVTEDFAASHPDMVSAFLQVTEDANAMYQADPASMQDTIAEAAGMDLDGSNAVLANFSFPSKDQQLSADWFGGTVQTFIKDVADFFVEQGELDAALDSYDGTIDTSFLEGINGFDAMMMEESMDDGAMADMDGTICNLDAPADAVEVNMIGWAFPITEFYAEELNKCNDVENVTVNTQLLASTDAQEQVKLALSAGGDSPYDIVHGANGQVAEWAGAGWMMPLNDMVEKYWDEYNLGDIPATAWEGATLDGNIYGVPMVGNTLHMIYRTDIFEELGLEVPETYAEVIEVCNTIGLDNPDYDMPFTVNLSAGWAWEIEFFAMQRAFGGKFLDDANNPTFNDETGVAAAEMLTSVADACMGEAGYSFSLNDQEVAMQLGTLPMTQMWASRAANMTNEELTDLGDVIGYAMAPRAVEGGPSTGTAWNDYYMIPAGTTNDAEMIFKMIMEAADEASQAAAAETGMASRASAAEFGGPYQPAAVQSISEGVGIYDKNPAVAIVRAKLGEFLPLIGTGEMTAQEALDAAAAAYTEEADAQGMLGAMMEESDDGAMAMAEGAEGSLDCTLEAPAAETEINMIGWSFPITDFYAGELDKCNSVEGLTVNAQLLASTDAQEQVNLALSAGGDSPYDIVHGANGQVAEWAGAGWMMPLNDMVEKYWDEYNLGDIPATAWEGATLDGNIYGVPMVGNTLHMIYRTDIFEELGLEVPETYAEVIEVCNTIGLDNPDYDMPFTVNLSAGWAWEIEFFAMQRAFGGKFLDDANNPTFNDETGVAAAEMLTSVADACMGEAGYSFSLNDQEVAMQLGTLPMTQMWASRAANMTNEELTDLGDVIGYAMAPRAVEGGPSTGTAWNDYYMIPAGTTNDADYIFRLIMDAADMASQAEAAATGMASRTSAAEFGGPYQPAAVQSIAEGVGIYDKNPAVAIVRSKLGEFLPLIGSGEMTAEEALNAAADAYIEEAKAQGFIDG